MLQMSKKIDCNLGIFSYYTKLFYRSHDMIFEMFEIENFINKNYHIKSLIKIPNMMVYSTISLTTRVPVTDVVYRKFPVGLGWTRVHRTT